MILSHRTAALVGAIPGSPEKHRPFFFAPILCIGITLMFFLGFMDDVLRLKP